MAGVLPQPLPSKPSWGDEELLTYEVFGWLHRDARLEHLQAIRPGPLFYLATPYTKVCTNSDDSWDMQLSRLCGEDAVRWCRHFAEAGITAISPIALAVSMVHQDFDEWLDPLDEVFWTNWCEPLLRQSQAVIVPPLSGWDESAGVWHEAREALHSGRCVFLIDPEERPKNSPWLDDDWDDPF